MKEKSGSKKHKVPECLGSTANAFMIITIIVLQVLVLWNIGLMLFDNEEPGSGKQEVRSEGKEEGMRRSTTPERETKFNERRFEIEVIQPQQEMLEKFPNHPNLVFSKLSKAIQKEDKR